MIFLGSSQNSDLQGNTEVAVESTTPKPKNGDEVIVNKNNIDEKNFVKPQQKSNFDENDIDIAEALLANKEHKDQLNIDVKIGDGMDIAIHGENGKQYNLLPISFFCFSPVLFTFILTYKGESGSLVLFIMKKEYIHSTNFWY